MIRYHLLFVVCALFLVGCDYDASHSVRPKESKVLSADVTGLTYGTAQMVRWLDSEYFIVGRWDGTITLFDASVDNEASPQLMSAFVTKDGEGVRLLLPKDVNTFLSSGNDRSLMVWRKDASKQFLSSLVEYPAVHGFAVSGLFVTLEGIDYLITGHEKGDLLIWSVSSDMKFTLLRSIDLRMKEPIDYEHADEPLRHIRGLSMWKDGIVIAGGEDGGLHQVQLPEGLILAQRLFNSEARLGINDLTVHGDMVLSVNCALDQHDKNLWLYGLKHGAFEYQDSINLLEDKNRKRIFAFDVVTYTDEKEPLALVTSKEGLLWQVQFEEGKLEHHSPLRLGRFHYGNAIDYEESSNRIAAAGVGVRLVELKNQ